MKKALSILMTFSLLLSAFAPTVSATGVVSTEAISTEVVSTETTTESTSEGFVSESEIETLDVTEATTEGSSEVTEASTEVVASGDATTEATTTEETKNEEISEDDIEEMANTLKLHTNGVTLKSEDYKGTDIQTNSYYSKLNTYMKNNLFGTTYGASSGKDDSKTMQCAEFVARALVGAGLMKSPGKDKWQAYDNCNELYQYFKDSDDWSRVGKPIIGKKFVSTKKEWETEVVNAASEDTFDKFCQQVKDGKYKAGDVLLFIKKTSNSEGKTYNTFGHAAILSKYTAKDPNGVITPVIFHASTSRVDSTNYLSNKNGRGWMTWALVQQAKNNIFTLGGVEESSISQLSINENGEIDEDAFNAMIEEMGGTSVGVAVYRYEDEVGSYMQVKKVPSKTPTNSEYYSLEGIEYGVYSDKECTDLLKTLTLKANGKSNKVSLTVTAGETRTVYLKEIEDSVEGSGFKYNSKVYTVTLTDAYTKDSPLVYGVDVNPNGVKDDLEAATLNVHKVTASNCATMVAGNPNYSLAGAEYAIYSSYMNDYVNTKATWYPTEADLVAGTNGSTANIKTDANGNTPTVYVEYGTYYVREEKPSPGYIKATDCPHKVTLQDADGERNKTITCNEPITLDPVAINITKDAKNGTIDTSKYSLAGAIFEIAYYNQNYTEAELEGKTPTKKWYVQTDANGEVDFTNPQYHVSTNQFVSDELYLNASGKVGMPAGVFTVREVKGPDGYGTATSGSVNGTEIDKSVLYGKVVVDANGESHAEFEGTTGNFNIVIPEPETRGDITFTKVDYETKETMAGIPFKITNNLTGESHIVVTDKNGVYNSAASVIPHTTSTNGNDGKTADYTSVGLWFFGNADTTKHDMTTVDDTQGAFIVGDGKAGSYTIEELPCEANEGKQLITPYVFTVTSADVTQVKNIGTISNVPEPFLDSLEWDSDTKTHVSSADDDVTVMDTVTYNFLTAGKKYTLKGILMEISTNADGTNSATPLIDDNGNYVTSNHTFTVPSDYEDTDQEKCGTEDVEFKFSGVDLKGIQFVVYEYLYDGEDNTVLQIKDGVVDESGAIKRRDGSVVKHADANDIDQIGYFPDIRTEAWSSETGINSVAAGPDVEIVDTVNYTGLKAKTEYTLVATIAYMDEDGKEAFVLDKDGKKVTAEKTFTTDRENGSVDIVLPKFDATPFEGKSVVIYEELYQDGALAGEHKDINDKKQTIYFPSIGTTATDSETSSHMGLADSEVTIIDTVQYTSLAPGKEYTLSGTLMDKETGNALLDAKGKEISSSITFTPSEPNGEVDISFTFDGSLLAGKTTVAFETVSYNGKELTFHKDITDENQTVYFPNLKTSLRDAETGIKNTIIDNEVTLIDTVTYSNIVKDRKYKVAGYLMNKDTNEPILVNGQKVTGEATFNATDTSGTVDVTYKFDGLASDFIKDGKTSSSIVCFETLIVTEEYAEEGHYETVTKDAWDEQTYKTVLTCDTCSAVLSDMTDAEFAAHTAEHGAYTETLVEDEVIHHGPTEEEVYVKDKDAVTKDCVIAIHEDINDVDQTVNVPSGKTIAKDKESGTHTAYPDEEVTIVDSVYYKGLNVGETYTIKGQLYLRPETVTEATVPEPLLVDGKPVTAETTFVATSESGTIDMTFTFNASALKGQMIVVFENCYNKDKLVFTHADIEDDDQTIHFPEIGTTATDKDGDKELSIKKKVTLIDTIEYKNLTVGETYYIYGTVMDASTKKAAVSNGEKVKVKVKFVPKKSNGKTKVTFEFDTTGLENRKLVVFEEIKTKNGTTIALHKDWKSKSQTVTVPDAPKTGVVTPFTILLIVGLVAIAGIGVILYKRKKLSN